MYSHLHHNEIARLYRESTRRAQERRSQPRQRTVKWDRVLISLVLLAVAAFDLFVILSGSSY